MISDAVESLRIRYHGEQAIDHSFYNELGASLVGRLLRFWKNNDGEDDGLVAIGIQFIHPYPYI